MAEAAVVGRNRERAKLERTRTTGTRPYVLRGMVPVRAVQSEDAGRGDRQTRDLPPLPCPDARPCGRRARGPPTDRQPARVRRVGALERVDRGGGRRRARLARRWLGLGLHNRSRDWLLRGRRRRCAGAALRSSCSTAAAARASRLPVSVVPLPVNTARGSSPAAASISAMAASTPWCGLARRAWWARWRQAALWNRAGRPREACVGNSCPHPVQIIPTPRLS